MSLNPFLATQDILRHSFYVHYGNELAVTTVIVYVLGGLNLSMVLATLVLRWRGGEFWLFRVYTRRETGKLLTPNPLLCWLLSSLAFFAFALYYNYRTYQARTVGSDLTNYTFCIMTPWIFIWIGGWIWAWSQALAPFLSPPIDGAESASHRGIPRMNAKFLTAFYPITLACSITTLLTLGILADTKFNKLFTVFKSLDALLSVASSAVETGSSSVAEDVTSLTAAQLVFYSTFDEFADRWTAVWIGWVVLDVLFLFVFTYAVVVQWRSLSQAISVLQASHFAGDNQRSRHRKRLIWSYRSFVATSMLIVVTCALALCSQAPLAVKSVSVKALQGAELTKVLRLASLLFPTAISSGINSMIFGLAILNFHKRASGSHETTVKRPYPSTAVLVTVDVELHETNLENKKSRGDFLGI